MTIVLLMPHILASSHLRQSFSVVLALSTNLATPPLYKYQQLHPITNMKTVRRTIRLLGVGSNCEVVSISQH